MSERVGRPAPSPVGVAPGLDDVEGPGLDPQPSATQGREQTQPSGNDAASDGVEAGPRVGTSSWSRTREGETPEPDTAIDESLADRLLEARTGSRATIHLEARTSTVSGHESWEFNKYVPTNSKEKGRLFVGLSDAERALALANRKAMTAEAQVQAAKSKLDRAVAKHGEDSPQAAKAQREMDRAVGQRQSADREVALKVKSADDAEEKFRKFLVAQAKPGDRSVVQQLNLRRTDVERDHYTATVSLAGKDVKVSLQNASDSPWTVSQEGLHGRVVGDSREATRAQIESSRLSEDKRATLLAVSSNEGPMSAVNGYDRAGTSFGMRQSAFGTAGSNFTNLLVDMKKNDRANFDAVFVCNGIDVAANGELLVTTDGQTLKGNAAAAALGAAPRLLSLLAAAGTLPSMQAAQLRQADAAFDGALGKGVAAQNGTNFEAGHFLTSDRAVGLYYDRFVQDGESAAPAKLRRLIKDYLAAHPDADLDSLEVRNAIDAKYIETITSTDAGRAKVFASFSTEPGSFQR